MTVFIGMMIIHPSPCWMPYNDMDYIHSTCVHICLTKINSLVPERCRSNFTNVHFELRQLIPWACSVKLVFEECHITPFNDKSTGNGSVPSSSKPLPEPDQCRPMLWGICAYERWICTTITNCHLFFTAKGPFNFFYFSYMPKSVTTHNVEFIVLSQNVLKYFIMNYVPGIMYTTRHEIPQNPLSPTCKIALSATSVCVCLSSHPCVTPQASFTVHWG